MARDTKRDQRPDLSHELALWNAGCAQIAGLDEAGRGALAGPVVAAAVMLPSDRFDLSRALSPVRDSKLLSHRQRWVCEGLIRQVAVSWGLGQAEPGEIDELGLLPATRLAMARAVEALDRAPVHLLIDHISLPEIPIPQSSITRGDAQVLSIAAASVLAKVARDRNLVDLDRQYPGYGFARHKGYATAHHRTALQRLGPTPVHRLSYSPVAAALIDPKS